MYHSMGNPHSFPLLYHVVIITQSSLFLSQKVKQYEVLSISRSVTTQEEWELPYCSFQVLSSSCLKQKTMSLLLVNNKTIFKKLLNNPRCLYWFVSLPTLQEFLKFPEVKTFSMGFMLINFGCPWWRWLKWATHPDSFYSHQSVNKYF